MGERQTMMRFGLLTIFALYAASVTADWQYRVDEDKMSGEKSYFASVLSQNSVNLKFPYEGGTRVQITVRKGSKGQYGDGVRDVVLIDVFNGQVVCPGQKCVGRIKFDSRLEKFTLRAPRDGSTSTLGIFEVPYFVSKLKKSKRVFLELELYKGGAQIFEFDTSGFVWKHH
ncbi:MAG: hypothetical protein HGA47_08335 [Zoogloea sp.]|nr:hypothetical protein [Zoogloea sp.]